MGRSWYSLALLYLGIRDFGSLCIIAVDNKYNRLLVANLYFRVDSALKFNLNVPTLYIQSRYIDMKKDRAVCTHYCNSVCCYAVAHLKK